MASVSVIFKIYPKDGEFEKALAEIKKLGPKGTQSEDIGFGIKIIKALFTFDDKSSSSEKFEQQLRAISSVSEVEVMEESLI